MDQIIVNKLSDTQFEVTVESHTTTSHVVTLPEVYYQKITNERVSREDLIKKSFEFLLQREPNTSILRSFELSVISRYFPEYERTIKSMF